MAVELSYRYFGGEGNPPLVILHGLFGSSRNWQTAAKALVAEHEVFALDLRNHGNSPHHDEVGYGAMVDDLQGWIGGRGLGPVNLLGHSAGGKVAMAFACRYPSRVSTLVVADIAPRDYPAHHGEAVRTLLALDLAAVGSRAGAEAALAKDLGDADLRRFLLSNLVREPDGVFRWRFNLPALAAGLAEFARNPLAPGDRFDGPVLFVRGGRSDYVTDADAPTIGQHFPHYILSTVAGAGHNVHVDNRQAFLNCLEFFRERQAEGPPVGRE